MRYVLIDNDGEMHVKDGTVEQARAEVGPDGWDHVYLPPNDGRLDWAGWVNDDGHRLGLPRNIVGGLILNGVGARPMPYAGPIVITGWEEHGQPTEVAGLCEHRIAAIQEIHRDARRALAGEPEQWADAARDIAEFMRTAPTPTVEVLTADEFFARMRGGS